MREQFLRDNWERLDEDNYEFKRRDMNDEVRITKEINEKKKRLKKKWPSYFFIFIFGFEHVYFISWCIKLLFLGII